ncbi:hypothetical protein B0H11DRAFT_1752413 [Mycena galericulata]|nr:hypothetical protein B0H11DRAFT_1752413 [Mycena galericulata]
MRWAKCVSKFFDFEAAHGYKEGGQMRTKGRPTEVTGWLARARKWNARMDVGTVGEDGLEGTFADGWWKWWRSIQPSDRKFVGGILTAPEEADWSDLSKLHGKNGMLQVMATLLWWGDKVGVDENAEGYGDWRLALGDVTWVLEQLVEAAEEEEEEEEEEE